jgi:hypothetical protein
MGSGNKTSLIMRWWKVLGGKTKVWSGDEKRVEYYVKKFFVETGNGS